MSSKKVPTKRNRLEIIFKAYTEGEIISEQASILRDVFDNVNATIYDGGMDQIYKPLPQIFSCLKGHDYSQGFNMRGFLNLFISRWGIDENKINNLASYFNVP